MNYISLDAWNAYVEMYDKEIKLTCDGVQLNWSAKKGTMTKTLLHQLKKHKYELMQLLEIYNTSDKYPYLNQEDFKRLPKRRCISCSRFTIKNNYGFYKKQIKWTNYSCERYTQLALPTKLCRCRWFKERKNKEVDK